MTTDSTINRESAFRQEYPFESNVLDLDGLRFHFIDEGMGPPILFVHGNPTWSFAWRNLVKGLSGTHRCLAVDHIGCGFSDKPQHYDYRLSQHIDNLETFVTRLDLREITLVAHDWGGAIGLGTVLRQQERFSRVVLMNTAAFRSRAIPWRIAACRIPVLGTLAVRGLNAFSGAATWMAVTNPLPKTIREGYTRPYDSWANRIATLRFVEDIPLSPNHPSYARLKEIEEQLPQLEEMPFLFLWGMRDWCFTPTFLAEFEQRFPRADVRRFNEAGHYLFEDEPEAVLTAISEFAR